MERVSRNLFRTVLYGSRLTGEVESVRFVTPDVAVVHLTGSVVEGKAALCNRAYDGD